MPKILILMGTRPEAIKLAPVISAMGTARSSLKPIVGLTGQHSELLEGVQRIFKFPVDFDLRIMRKGQTLTYVTAAILSALGEQMESIKPDMILVQGDTTSAFAAALAAYYRQIPIGHVEAGLRTHDKYQPFPEEGNRILIDQLADLAFAPTQANRGNLLRGGIPEERIFVTGNTGIDALLQLRAAAQNERLPAPEIWAEKFVLVTVHRRENFGKPLRRIFGALRRLAERFRNIQFIYPVHPNPMVVHPAREWLSGLPNLDLLPPLDYFEFLALMQRAHLILTDSGGVQEEAPTFGVPVLILRERTERQEVVDAGCGLLVGTQGEQIIAAATELLQNERRHQAMAARPNPFGDGKASARIIRIIEDYFSKRA